MRAITPADQERRVHLPGEPEDQRQKTSRSSGPLNFVVQKHSAGRMHYDFRLEMEGVFKSWVVPKGIPLDKGEPCLAVEVEDHPLNYDRFEGIIPPGNYGAGTVQLWDRGTYEATDGAPGVAWTQGKISFMLHGKKLKGHWTLVRARSEAHPQNSWLLIKTAENVPSLSTEELGRSVLSGKTMAELTQSRKILKGSRESKAAPSTSLRARIQSLVARTRGV